MMNIMRTFLFANSALMVFVLPHAAEAHDAATSETAAASEAPAASTDAEASQSGDIIVTARRREERLNDVPVAVTALSTQALADRNIARVTDISKAVPGLLFAPDTYGSSQPTFIIRGLRPASPYISVDAPTTVYFAEAPIARTHGVNGAVLDLASVQVLKGPQGTLFGRNNTGGAILLTPRAPSDKFEGYVQLTGGSLNLKIIEGAVNVPISDNLALRVVGQVHRENGYMHSFSTGLDLGDERNESWRASLKWTPASDVTDTLIYYGYHEEDSGNPTKTYQVNPTGGSYRVVNPAGAVALLAEFNSLQTKDYYSTYNPSPADGTKASVWGLVNTLKVDTSFGSVKSITSYRSVRSLATYPIDSSSLRIYNNTENMDVRQLTEEVQLQGQAFDNNLTYTGGVFYFRETGTEDVFNHPFGGFSTAIADLRNSSEAIYAQFTYKLPYNISFTAGGRYTHDDRQAAQRSLSSPTTCRLVNADSGGVPLNPCYRIVATSFNEPTYNFSLDWKPQKDLLLYVSYARGYKSGGFDITASTPSQALPFLPEFVNTLEGGVKGDWRWGDARLTANVAVFTEAYKNIQRNLTRALVAGGPVLTTVANAASANISGGEAEIMFSPVPALRLSVNWTHLSSHYNLFIGPNNTDLSGAAFATSPKNVVSAQIQYLHNFEGAGEFKATLTGFSQDSFWALEGASNYDVTTKQNLPYDLVPAFHTLDARLELSQIAGTGLSASFYVKNLTAEKYILGQVDTYLSLGFANALLGKPRTFGVELKYQF